MSGKRKGTNTADLPKYLYYRGGRGDYYYKRPDNKKCVTVGSDRVIAIATAGQLNKLFGVNLTLNQRRVVRQKEWIAYAKRKARTCTFPYHIKLLVPDYFPKTSAATSNEVVSGWADSRTVSKFKPGEAIDLSTINNAPAPRWLSEIYRRTKRNAERRGLKFTISLEDLVQLIRESDGRCAVTGIPLSNDEVKSDRKHTRRPWAPSVDRINSEAGYSITNCRIVCVAANYAMGMWGEDVLICMAKAIAMRHLDKKKVSRYAD